MSLTNTNRTALISFYLDEEETTIFWLEKDLHETQVYKVQVGRQTVAAAAQKLQNIFSQGINCKHPEHTAGLDLIWLADLTKTLFEPLLNRLDKCQTLVIAPHRELHGLPLHLVPFDGNLLALTHAVSYVGNLSIYAMLINREATLSPDFTSPSVCISVPASEDREIFRQNFALVPKAFAGKTGGIFLKDTEATREIFLQKAGLSKNIYLSCHGVFDKEEALKSSLYLSDGKTLPSKGRDNDFTHALSVKDILSTEITSQLVVLDACMSGQQRIISGDESMGFPTAFFISGVSSVIASNWIVDQNCAKFFMTALLDRWSSDGTSLGEAMKAAFSRTRESFPHPFHWGAFSLFGNDRLKF